MELHQLRVFVALAEERSMTTAAERLHVSQPAISFALAQLEKELKVGLFHRSNRGLTLTAQGQELLDKARSVVRGAEEIESSGKERSDTEGPVRIAGRPGFMQYVMPLLLKSLGTALPNIRVEAALSGSSEEVVAALRTGQADLAFAASPKIKSITAEVIYHDPVWLAVSRSHPLTKKSQILFSDLAGLQFCVPVSSDRLRASIDRFLRQVGKPTIAMETNDYTVMKNLIASGKYAGFVYAHMMLSSDSHSIHPLKIKGLQIVRDLTILHRRDDLLPHVAKTRDILIHEAKNLLKRNEDKFD